MNYAVYNPTTREIRTIVTEPKGDLPDGFEFVREDQLPVDAVRAQESPIDPQDEYESALAAGYVDATTKIHLKTDRASQTLFTSQVTLIQLAASAKMAPANVDIWDYSGEKHTITLAEFYGLMLRYGMYCQGLFAQHK